MYLCIINISSIFYVTVFPLADGIACHVLDKLRSETMSKIESYYGLSYETQLWYGMMIEGGQRVKHWGVLYIWRITQTEMIL